MDKKSDILVIDDDPTQARLSTELLRHAGYNVDSLTDSTQAMDYINANRPRMVILDLMMPGLDGLSLCKMIKEDPNLKDTKVVFLTAKVFDVDKRKALSLGADVFLNKPVDNDELVNNIKSLLNGK
jgi:DNA-binding response OmpR family regulator